jgi:uncharacterized coiled-coil protein SlyX
MTTKIEDAAYMVFVERQIMELEGRLAALKNVIEAMNVEGVDSSNQTELFTNMSEVVRAVQRLREDVLSDSGAACAPETASTSCSGRVW